MMHVAPRRPVTRLLLISLAAWSVEAHALGLGAIALQSGLGRPLQASIPVLGLTPDDAGANCLKSRVLALDGSVLARPTAELSGSGASAMLNVRTTASMNEPVMTVVIEIGCANSVKREYQLLLDPLPAGQQTVATLPAERIVRSARGTSTALPVMAPAPAAPVAQAAAPASVVRKRPVPAKPNAAASTKSVLTLSAGDAEIEQVRASLALRYATTLSEPHQETDPARLSTLRADQARVAALLRGENPLAAAQAEARDAQGKLQSAQQLASSTRLQLEKEKAALLAAQEDMVPRSWVIALGASLLACVAAIGWLVRRRADDRRRQEQAFFDMAVEHDDTPDTPLPTQQAKAAILEPEHQGDVASVPQEAPVFQAPPELPELQFAAPSPPAHEWAKEPIDLPVAVTPPEPLAIPESWLLIENNVEAQVETSPADAALAFHAASFDESAQRHATEVASLLLEAEDWMAEHNPVRAADVLQPYMKRSEMRSPAPGLYLLSLYRTADDEIRLQTVLAQLQQAFPAEAGQWSNPTQPRRRIADFPLVHAMVDTLSETEDLLPYLNSLLLAPDQFDFPTYREIVRAIRLATEQQQQERDAQSMSLDFH